MDLSEKQKIITDIIQRVVGYMRVDCQVNFNEEPNASGKTLVVSVHAPEYARFLIGRDGENLKAFEQIVRLLFYKLSNGEQQSLTLDVNDYRRTQALRIVEIVKQTVGRVRGTQKAEAMSPMSSYERRVVHMELAAYPDITTESIGEEPQRRVVIKPFP